MGGKPFLQAETTYAEQLERILLEYFSIELSLDLRDCALQPSTHTIHHSPTIIKIVQKYGIGASRSEIFAM